MAKLMPMLFRYLARRRDARQRVGCDATDLLNWMGEPAYDEARSRARALRAKGDATGDRHWGKVAVEIAARTGRTIGKGAMRPARPTIEEKRGVSNRSATSRDLVEIAQAIADLARSRQHATTLHNAQAAVHRLAALSRAPHVQQAASEVTSALADLAAAPDQCAAARASGVYPPRAEAVGKALQRLRTALDRSRL